MFPFLSRIIVFYLVFCGIIYSLQRFLIYRPFGEIKEISEYGLVGFNSFFLETPDNQKILVWFKGTSPSKKIIIYFHGNGGNMAGRSHKFATYAKDFDILALSYRGYPGSSGKPTEQSIYSDARIAVNFLLDQGYQENNLIFYGESLGSGTAIEMAKSFDSHAVILEAPFSSLTNIAQKIYWYLPVKYLLKDKFDSISKIPSISSPILIFHGDQDRVVPISEGKKLYRSIKSYKKMIVVPGADHLEFQDEFLLKNIKEFLKEIVNPI